MNPYIPKMFKIEKVKKESPEVKSFWFKMPGIKFNPGQVIMVSVLGFGESTFGIIPTERKDVYEFTMRKTGTVTDKLFDMTKGKKIGIRGPFGKGYPVKYMKGKNIMLIAGGIGIPPIKSLLLDLIKKREEYKNISLLYGARTPADIVYKNDIKKWKKEENIEVKVTVDKADKKWKGNVGVVTELIGCENKKETVACMCGPCVMSKFVCKKLKGMGIKENQIYVSMERLMKCGIGMCGHCNIGKAYVCKDGPVFRLDKLMELTEGVW